jgi:hypothetical protein
MTAVTPPAPIDDLAARATDLAASKDEDAASVLIDAAGGDRAALEAARDQLASYLHTHTDDWRATGGLTLLNRVLASLPHSDPFDWRVRWAHHRKP